MVKLVNMMFPRKWDIKNLLKDAIFLSLICYFCQLIYYHGKECALY